MTRFSGDLPVRRWSRGRFAFRRAAVAPLVLKCIWQSGMTAADASSPSFPHLARGMSPSAPTSMAWVPETGGVRKAPRCGPSGAGSVACASRELCWCRAPRRWCCSAAADVSGASATPRTYTEREPSSTLRVVQILDVGSPSACRAALRPRPGALRGSLARPVATSDRRARSTVRRRARMSSEMGRTNPATSVRPAGRRSYSAQERGRTNPLRNSYRDAAESLRNRRAA
jgi:hypothetical protein